MKKQLSLLQIMEGEDVEELKTQFEIFSEYAKSKEVKPTRLGKYKIQIRHMIEDLELDLMASWDCDEYDALVDLQDELYGAYITLDEAMKGEDE